MLAPEMVNVPEQCYPKWKFNPEGQMAQRTCDIQFEKTQAETRPFWARHLPYGPKGEGQKNAASKAEAALGASDWRRRWFRERPTGGQVLDEFETHRTPGP